MRVFSERNIIGLLGLLVLFTSCISMGKISIQVSVAPPRAVPDEIQSIVLMNRSMTSEFSNLNPDSLEALFIRKNLHLDNVFLDSLAADTTLRSIGNALYESGRFDVVIPLRRNLPNIKTSYKDSSPSLTLAQVKQICDEFKTDALLCLDNFYEKVNTSYQVEMFSPYTNEKEYNAYIQVAYHSNWKLYQPKEKLMIAKFEVKDTISWERYGRTLQDTYENLPMIREALMDGAVENGKNLAAYISPGWKAAERSYFITKNQEADKAISLLKSNEWKEAETVWLKFSQSNNAGFRSQIEFNLALAAEMNGNMDGAITWAKKSLQSKYSKVAENYIRLLSTQLEKN